MSAWVGGVAFLVAVVPVATRLLEPGERSRLLAGVVARFSTIALISVAALLATGILQSVVHLQLLRGAALQRLRARDRDQVGAGGAADRGGRRQPPAHAAAPARRPPSTASGPGCGRGRACGASIRGELALMAMAIARHGRAGGLRAAGRPRPPGPVSLSRDLGPARLEMTVAPARVGRNEIHLYLFDRQSRRPVRPARRS